MPLVTWRIANPPGGATHWKGNFLRRRPDDLFDVLASNDGPTGEELITAPLVFSSFTDVTGFWQFFVFGPSVDEVRFVPGLDINIVAVDGDFTLEWGSKISPWLLAAAGLLGVGVVVAAFSQARSR